MAIQNEAVDEDLEHFEDAPDDTENSPSSEANMPSKSNGVDEGSVNDFNFDNDSSEDEEASSASSSGDDISGEDEDLLMRKNVEKPQESSFNKLPDENGYQLESKSKHSLPGGYDPRHREPSFCNADHTSWWELTVLASHTHPSVSTMARTLLSGATIVYNGNPLNDLSLTAFLDKFMEKKPKQSTWHGGSRIEPAKKLDMNKHLVGPEILALAETDVPPEDLVFHKFYMNKTGSSAKPKKKKKKGAVEAEAAELCGGDESDNEEIDNLLDSTEAPLEADGDYDYDDLDKVANEDDDDLIGDVSDNEMDMDMLSDDGEAATDDGHAPNFDSGESDGDDDMSDVDDMSDDDIKIGDMDDVSEDEDGHAAFVSKKGKKKSSASPFASLEDYEHLLNDDAEEEKSDEEDNKVKSQGKRKHNDKSDQKKSKKAENKNKHKRKRSKTLD